MSWKEFGDWAFYACAVSSISFALLYALFAPWRSTTTGRNIMAVMGSLALALAYFAWVKTIGGVPHYFYPARAILFTGIAWAITWRIVMLVQFHILPSLRAKRDRRRDELEHARKVDHDGPGSGGHGSGDLLPGGGRERRDTE